jgi:hypothetical protein
MAYVMRPAKKRLRKQPMALRMSTQHEVIARYLLTSWTAEPAHVSFTAKKRSRRAPQSGL